MFFHPQWLHLLDMPQPTLQLTLECAWEMGHHVWSARVCVIGYRAGLQ